MPPNDNSNSNSNSTSTAFSGTQRIGLFIDGANTHAACSRLDLELDYDKVLEYWRERGQLVHAFYYTALKDNESGERNPLKDFAARLSYRGYRVISKIAKTFSDSSGGYTTKGNMDVELTVDMLRTCIRRQIDYAILFSGDGDFRRLVEACQDEGVRVAVISSISSQPSTCSDELRRQADMFIDIKDVPSICRPRRNR